MAKKYFSYSEMRLFNQDQEAYYKKYILGEEIPSTPEQKLGTIIHKAMANRKYEWLKDMKEQKFTRTKIIKVRKLLDKAETKRAPASEVSMFAQDKLTKYVAIFDGFDKANRVLYEYKTSDRPELWNNWIVDYHQQLSFYAYIYWLNIHQYFKEIILYYFDTKKGNLKTFKTVRSRRDIVEIKDKIFRTITEIQLKDWWNKRLSRQERQKQKLDKLL